MSSEVNLTATTILDLMKKAVVARTKQFLADNKEWEIGWSWGSKIARDELMKEREEMFSEFADDVLLIYSISSLLKVNTEKGDAPAIQAAFHQLLAEIMQFMKAGKEIPREAEESVLKCLSSRDSNFISKTAEELRLSR